MNEKRNTFEDFVSGNGLLNLTLCISVIFLMHTYTKILWLINPDGYALDAMLNLIESLFFGLVTFLVIRRANNVGIKVMFAFCEAVAVFLYYNSSWFGKEASWYLTSYISILSASSVFALGYISLSSYKQKVTERLQDDTLINEEVTQLLQQVTREKQKVTQLQNEVTRLENEVTNKLLISQDSNLQVTELKNKVTQLQNEVTDKETSLLSEVEKQKAVNKQIERDFEAMREASKEWERAWIKTEIANIKRGAGWELNQDKVNLVNQYQNRLENL